MHIGYNTILFFFCFITRERKGGEKKEEVDEHDKASFCWLRALRCGVFLSLAKPMFAGPKLFLHGLHTLASSNLTPLANDSSHPPIHKAISFSQYYSCLILCNFLQDP